MEKDAAGCPSLPLHHGIMNPGTRRTSPAVYPTFGRGTSSKSGITNVFSFSSSVGP